MCEREVVTRRISRQLVGALSASGGNQPPSRIGPQKDDDADEAPGYALSEHARTASSTMAQEPSNDDISSHASPCGIFGFRVVQQDEARRSGGGQKVRRHNVLRQPE